LLDFFPREPSKGLILFKYTRKLTIAECTFLHTNSVDIHTNEC